ncbi:unnamed protein product [Symbiodinium sp. CCMP2592]|nr:unnamed protein product [Symbiodinium sp. CCMP2592]
MHVSPLTPKSKRSAFGKSIAQNCSDNLDLIDQDQSGDLDHAEVETLLAAMGLQGDDSKNILLAIFRDGGRKTNHLELTEAILDNSDLDQETLEVMLGRVALFGKVFRRLDANGDGQLSLSEIIKMMEMLNIDTKLAADMMAFLDADDSGEVTWQEFVRGVCSNQFKVLFPEITLEALVDLPSSLQWDKFVSEDEQVSAIRGLPTVEKTLYWVLSLMYGNSSHRRISPEDDEDLRSLLHSSDLVVKRLSEKSAGRKSGGQTGLDTAIANIQEPAQPLAIDMEKEALPSLSSPCMAHVETVSKGAFAVSDIPALVKTMNQKTVVVVTRKHPKHPAKVQPATLRLGHAFSGTHTIVVRKEAKDPTSYARPASVQLKVPMPALPEKTEAPEPGDFQLVHFPVAEEMPPPAAAPPVLQKRRSSVSSLQGAVGAVSNMLNGITSAFGMSKETASKEPKVGTMSVAQAASYIRSMDVKVPVREGTFSSCLAVPDSIRRLSICVLCAWLLSASVLIAVLLTGSDSQTFCSIMPRTFCKG